MSTTPDLDAKPSVKNGGAKKMMIALAALMLAGCSPSYVWRESREPMTEAERKAVAAHAERIMAATPRTLAGDDQDWDDAIYAAHYAAKSAICRPVLREWKSYGFPDAGGEYTGRWKYADEPSMEAAK